MFIIPRLNRPVGANQEGSHSLYGCARHHSAQAVPLPDGISRLRTGSPAFRRDPAVGGTAGGGTAPGGKALRLLGSLSASGRPRSDSAGQRPRVPQRAAAEAQLHVEIRDGSGGDARQGSLALTLNLDLRLGLSSIQEEEAVLGDLRAEDAVWLEVVYRKPEVA